MNKQNREAGFMNPLLIPLIVLVVAVLGLGGFATWAYINYSDYKNNAQEKIDAAVADAKKKQSEEDELKFAEREKEPNRTFIGPDELGRVELDYPKTWSSFIGNNGAGSRDYQAYFHPVSVPPLDSKTPYAIRVTVENKTYDMAVAGYQDLIKKGELKSSPIAIEGINGNRLDGNFSKEIQGSMVLFKIRDKTLKVYTESNTFRPDFDKALKTLKFNQ